MSRRDRYNADAVAAQASEAARILQAQRHKQEPAAAAPEPSPEPQAPALDLSPDKPLPPVRNDRRDEALKEMWNKDRDRKGLTGNEPPPEPVAVQENLPPPTPEQMLQGSAHSQPEPEAEAPKAEAPSEEQAPTIEYVRVKVDGEEFDAPKADVEEAGGIKAYQRDKASERRLAKANESVAEARRLYAEMQAQAQALAKPAEPQVTDDEFVAQRLDAIRYGTPAEAAKALAEIQQRSAPPKVDQQAVISEAMTRMNYMQGVKQFTNEFKDLTQDPDLMLIIQAKASAGIQAMPDDKSGVDWSEFYRKIGNDIRIRFGRPDQPAPDSAAQPTGNTSQVSTDREARKASIVNLPTAAARAKLPEDPKPKTRADILGEMRKARGLPNG